MLWLTVALATWVLEHSNENFPNTESNFEQQAWDTHFSGNNFVNRLHPASHCLAFHSLQEQTEFRQQLGVTLEIVAVIVYPVSHNIQNSVRKRRIVRQTFRDGRAS